MENKVTKNAGLLAVACISLVASLAYAGHHSMNEDKAAKADIVATAVGAGQFNTLAAALTAAGLVETLQGEGPFTVFAPTDDAFAKLPEGTVEEFLKPENRDQLTSNPDVPRRGGCLTRPTSSAN